MKVDDGLAPPSDGILVGHPGRQHSRQLADALERGGFLKAYCSGQYGTRRLERLWRPIRRILPISVALNAIPPLGDRDIRTNPVATVLHHAAGITGSRSAVAWAELVGAASFDRWFAKKARSYHPAAVVGYEMATLGAFRAAKALGALCVLDAAACHFSLQDELLAVPASVRNRAPGALVRKRKAREVELADLIICPSQLSLDSYVAGGAPRSKLRLNSLGVDRDMFAYHEDLRVAGIARIGFVGNSGHIKGLDLLIEALHSVGRGAEFVLEIAGAASSAVPENVPFKVIRRGKSSAPDVARLLASCDFFVLPSRLESFGLVLLEALACGTPVISSRFAGASMLIEEGINGWVVDPRTAALRDRIAWCIDNVAGLRGMRPACVATAAANGWNTYGARTIAIFSELLRNSPRYIPPGGDRKLTTDNV